MIRSFSYGGTPCIEWLGGRNPKGYGRHCMEGGVVLAHRAAWEAKHGPIPAGMCVLHHCDNPPCINVDHLWLGTKADNNADMDAKGRANRKAHAKLTEAQAALIRTRRLAGERGVTLAREFGVSSQTVCDIVKGRIWAS